MARMARDTCHGEHGNGNRFMKKNLGLEGSMRSRSDGRKTLALYFFLTKGKVFDSVFLSMPKSLQLPRSLKNALRCTDHHVPIFFVSG